MKKIFFALLLGTFVARSVSAQKIIGDSIIMVTRFDGFRLYHKGKPITPNKAMRIMKSDEEAYKLMKSARFDNTMVTLLSFSGGFLIGWPMGTALAGGEPEWEMAGIGAGLILLAIPFATSVKKHTAKAVNIYNRRFRVRSTRHKAQLHFSVSGFGAGLALRF